MIARGAASLARASAKKPAHHGRIPTDIFAAGYEAEGVNSLAGVSMATNLAR